MIFRLCPLCVLYLHACSCLAKLESLKNVRLMMSDSKLLNVSCTIWWPLLRYLGDAKDFQKYELATSSWIRMHGLQL